MMLPVLGVAAQSTGVPAECLRSSGLELLRDPLRYCYVDRESDDENGV